MFRNTVPGKVHVMPLYVLDGGVLGEGPSEFSKAASDAYGAKPQAQKDNFKSAERLEILDVKREGLHIQKKVIVVVLVWVSLLIMGLSGTQQEQPWFTTISHLQHCPFPRSCSLKVFIFVNYLNTVSTFGNFMNTLPLLY